MHHGPSHILVWCVGLHLDIFSKSPDGLMSHEFEYLNKEAESDLVSDLHTKDPRLMS